MALPLHPHVAVGDAAQFAITCGSNQFWVAPLLVGALFGALILSCRCFVLAAKRPPSPFNSRDLSHPGWRSSAPFSAAMGKPLQTQYSFFNLCAFLP